MSNKKQIDDIAFGKIIMVIVDSDGIKHKYTGKRTKLKEPQMFAINGEEIVM